jgi:hypothetical protein
MAFYLSFQDDSAPRSPGCVLRSLAWRACAQPLAYPADGYTQWFQSARACAGCRSSEARVSDCSYVTQRRERAVLRNAILDGQVTHARSHGPRRSSTRRRARLRTRSCYHERRRQGCTAVVYRAERGACAPAVWLVRVHWIRWEWRWCTI